MPLSFFQDLFNASDFATFQADFNTMGMGLGFGQDVPDDTFCGLSRALIFFQHDQNTPAWFYFFTMFTAHGFNRSNRKVLLVNFDIAFSGKFSKLIIAQ
jgi:hypothetical protein